MIAIGCMFPIQAHSIGRPLPQVCGGPIYEMMDHATIQQQQVSMTISDLVKRVAKLLYATTWYPLRLKKLGGQMPGGSSKYLKLIETPLLQQFQNLANWSKCTLHHYTMPACRCQGPNPSEWPKMPMAQHLPWTKSCKKSTSDIVWQQCHVAESCYVTDWRLTICSTKSKSRCSQPAESHALPSTKNLGITVWLVKKTNAKWRSCCWCHFSSKVNWESNDPRRHASKSPKIGAVTKVVRASIEVVGHAEFCKTVPNLLLYLQGLTLLHLKTISGHTKHVEHQKRSAHPHHLPWDCCIHHHLHLHLAV